MDATAVWISVGSITAGVVAVGGVVRWGVNRHADIDNRITAIETSVTAKAEAIKELVTGSKTTEHSMRIRALETSSSLTEKNMTALTAVVERQGILLDKLDNNITALRVALVGLNGDNGYASNLRKLEERVDRLENK